MSITDMAMVGVLLGLMLVFLAIRLENKLNHPHRRHQKVWRHKTT